MEITPARRRQTLLPRHHGRPRKAAGFPKPAPEPALRPFIRRVGAGSLALYSTRRQQIGEPLLTLTTGAPWSRRPVPNNYISQPKKLLLALDGGEDAATL
jgi:hypothetical protein